MAKAVFRTALLLLAVTGCEAEAPIVPAPVEQAIQPSSTPPPEPPAAPRGVQVSETTETSITWIWTAVEGADAYAVQSSLDEVFGGEDAIFLVTETTHTVSGLPASTQVYLRVASAKGTSMAGALLSQWSTHVAGMTATPPPLDPEPACEPVYPETVIARSANDVAELHVECDWIDEDGVCHMVVYSDDQIRCSEYSKNSCSYFPYYVRNAWEDYKPHLHVGLCSKAHNPHPDDVCRNAGLESHVWPARSLNHLPVPGAAWASEGSDEYDDSWAVGGVLLIYRHDKPSGTTWRLRVWTGDDYVFVDLFFHGRESDQCQR